MIQPNTQSLAEARQPADFVIESFPDAGREALRLRELGFGPGRHVRVLHASDPMLCQLDHFRVGLDRRLAGAIQVRPMR
ncbi:MAG: FeoA family protein [Phycisphaerae bacterium]